MFPWQALGARGAFSSCSVGSGERFWMEHRAQPDVLGPEPGWRWHLLCPGSSHLLLSSSSATNSSVLLVQALFPFLCLQMCFFFAFHVFGRSTALLG